ncbi:hypothetical protein N7510_008111, partial [Penicillium lagena]|uniref:uncharacterized protein n=1 Tax=Penicillium lagena TaxID=94218 RepID=UPI0025405356
SSSATKGKNLHVAVPSSTDAETDIEHRLKCLERTVQSLAVSLEEVLHGLSALPRRDLSKIPNISNQKITSGENRSNSQLYIAPSHSFSFLQEAPEGIERLPRQGFEENRQSAMSEIRNLSFSLTAARVGNSMESSTTFHVPSRPAGYSLLGKFLEQAELGQPFFRSPSDEVLKQIVFEPQNVKEKAWVVFFNYVLLAAISTEQDEYEDKLRQNSQLALNDSRIFLEPSIVNVQALALLSIHGEDFAAPNVSWMLLGHACRQAEALGLHARAIEGTFDESQHRLCLFWMLFTLDKSCALAFGRPAFLPIALYRHVPLPDEQFMQNFRPHDTAVFGKQQQNSKGSDFGALLFKSTVGLAKLMSDVLEILGMAHSEEAKDDMQFKLDAWFSNTNMVRASRYMGHFEDEITNSQDQALTQAMDNERISADAKQIREMNLGISSINFQYLHVLTLLLKNDRTSHLRLSCAREAISLLPSLVSNWGSVYNGVIWQLLYYPFTPFFVIFENVIQQSIQYPTLEQDLRFLATMVTYYADMKSQMRHLASVCSKLQHTATVFLQLAQSHARNSNFTTPANNAAGISQHPNCSGLAEHGTEPWDDLTSTDLGNCDMTNYLNWLPVDMDVTSRILEAEIQDSRFHHSDCKPESSSTYLHRPTTERMFDWFLWDDYYGSVDI